MNEPEQNQQTKSDERRDDAGAAPVPSSSADNTERPAQKPAYGQYNQPEYGAMSSQYPAGYNPYVYGAPEPEPKPQSDDGQQNPQIRNAQYGQRNGQPYNRQFPNQPYGQPYGNQQPGNQNQWAGQPNAGQWNSGYPNPQNGSRQPYNPNYPGGINLDDPRQNPWYGHWDSYAIISFIFALFLPVPVLSAIMGAVSMWRTKKLHMKGYWLGFAAVVINVLYTITVIWLTVHGMSTTDLYNEMMQYMLGNGGGNGSDSITA